MFLGFIDNTRNIFGGIGDSCLMSALIVLHIGDHQSDLNHSSMSGCHNEWACFINASLISVFISEYFFSFCFDGCGITYVEFPFLALLRLEYFSHLPGCTLTYLYANKP